MFIGHVDCGFHTVGQDNELRRSAVVMAAKVHDVYRSHSGRTLAKKSDESKGVGFGGATGIGAVTHFEYLYPFFIGLCFFSRSNIASPRQAIPATRRIKSVGVGSTFWIKRRSSTPYLYPRANNLVNVSTKKLNNGWDLRLCFRRRNNIASTRQATATTARIESMTFTFYL
jgi:hypothetical protein